MLAGASDAGICLLEFTDQRMLETQIKRLKKWLQAEIAPGTHPLFEKLDAQLKAYFEGTLTHFNLPLGQPGAEFQRRVGSVLQEIPFGKTRSYNQQAEAVSNPACGQWRKRMATMALR